MTSIYDPAKVVLKIGGTVIQGYVEDTPFHSITSFSRMFSFLSNFYPATVLLDGVEFPSVEHAYQAAKTHNKHWRERIREQTSPGNAKRMGRRLRVRRDWDDVKLQVMEDLLRQKFSLYPTMKSALLATGKALLIEGNNWGDVYWGFRDGRGENHLGKLLMQIRQELGPPPLMEG